jgi:hypothetical protein
MPHRTPRPSRSKRSATEPFLPTHSQAQSGRFVWKFSWSSSIRGEMYDSVRVKHKLKRLSRRYNAQVNLPKTCLWLVFGIIGATGTESRPTRSRLSSISQRRKLERRQSGRSSVPCSWSRRIVFTRALLMVGPPLRWLRSPKHFIGNFR